MNRRANTEASLLPRPSRLARAVHLALAGGMLAATGLYLPAHAQAPAAQPVPAEAVKRYDIPAGPLGGVIARFASQSGVMLAGSSDLVQGRTSPGLAGSYAPKAAIDALLAGTGLEAVAQPNGSYTLRAATGANAVSKLPEILVTALGEGKTEGTGSYTTQSMSTATQIPMSIRETPQSVSVITRDRIEDQGLHRARDIMDYTPGVSSFATSPYRESYFARGFSIDNYMFDGLTVSTNSSRAGTFMNDMAMYDRVEVVRGAAGLTQGVGNPSAAINFVRKRPTREFRAEIEGHYGSWNNYGLQADVSGSLSQDGSVRGRAVVMGLDADSYQDVVEEQRALVYGIGEVELTRNTLLTFGGSYQKNNNIATYGGLPTNLDGSDPGLPRSAFMGNTWGHWDDQNTTIFADLEHRLGGGWKLKAAGTWMKAEQQQARAVMGYNDDTQAFDQWGGYAEIESERVAFDVNVGGPFRLFGREHEAILGVTGREAKEANDTAGYYGITLATNVNIYNWNHDAPIPPFPVDYRSRSRDKQYGGYATARFNLTDSVKALAGLRYDWYETEYKDDVQDWQATTWTQYSGGEDYDPHLTKYLGVTWDFHPNHTAYTSYTDIFQPQAERDTSNKHIDPVLGTNFEIGVKGEYFGGALNWNASWYRLDQENLAVEDGPCPFNPQEMCYRPAGVVRSEGYDLEVQGQVTPQWQVGAGYTYVATKIHKDANPDAVGTKLNLERPSKQFKLATTYKLGEQWRFGGGLRYQSKIEHTNDWMGPIYHTEQGAYTIFDLMAGYRFNRNIDVQVNVYNVADKYYFRAINTQPMQWGGNQVFGEPRRYLLTARYTF